MSSLATLTRTFKYGELPNDRSEGRKIEMRPANHRSKSALKFSWKRLTRGEVSGFVTLHTLACSLINHPPYCPFNGLSRNTMGVSAYVCITRTPGPKCHSITCKRAVSIGHRFAQAMKSILSPPPPMVQQPLAGRGLLIVEASRSHSNHTQ
jgi:hypothetical protein